MRMVVACLMFGSGAALAGADPILSCRTLHAEDPPAHITCLEQALRSQTAVLPSPEDGAVRGAGTLGAEQVRTSRRTADAAPDQMQVQITSVTYTAEGHGLFLMSDGQQWRETEKAPKGQRLNIDGQYTARIQRGMLGGYRMYVDGMRRMIKVERVK